MVEKIANSQNRYKDKICFVSGGTTGIGLAIAKLFALEGGKVYICSHSEEELEEVG